MPTATPPADSGWQPVRVGLEQRTINRTNSAGQQIEQLFLLRMEPRHFTFAVGYRPGEPQPLADWQQQTGALLVVNGGFFTETWQATGLTIVEGVGSGESYRGFGGMVAVTEGGIEVRALAERPFDPAEPLRYALQSFPMLVLPGGRLGFPDEDGQPSRRTVIGMDENGRLLLILAPWGSFSLHQLSRYLVQSDLALDVALNLDGGTSTGLLLADPPLEIPAFTPLPTVLLITPR